MRQGVISPPQWVQDEIKKIKCGIPRLFHVVQVEMERTEKGDQYTVLAYEEFLEWPIILKVWKEGNTVRRLEYNYYCTREEINGWFDAIEASEKMRLMGRGKEDAA